jgi:hypothetical protein
MQTVSSWGEAFMTSISSALMVFMAALPKIIAFALILVAGWFIASLIARGVAMLLRRVRFNELAQRAGVAQFMQNMGTDPAGFFAAVVKWFVRLIAVVVAFDALGLPAVSGFLREVLLWIPNLVVALVVIVIGGLAAKALSAFVRGAVDKADVGSPRLLGTIASVAVWTFTIIVAVNQLGIGATLVNTLFMGLVGALALALGLAFGLGGRDTAGNIVRKMYERAQSAAPQMQQAASAGAQQAREMKDQHGWRAPDRSGDGGRYSGQDRRRGFSPAYSGMERRTS